MRALRRALVVVGMVIAAVLVFLLVSAIPRSVDGAVRPPPAEAIVTEPPSAT